MSRAAVQKRFAYTTVDQHGKPASSTAVLYLPAGPAPEGGWPLLAWAHGTVGLGQQCTPSLNPQSPRDQEYLNHWLSQGYAIVASDYAGLGTPGLHSYLNGKVTAANVVDSVLATQNMAEAKDISRRWAVVGHSQGGGAALHVAHRASALSASVGLDFRGTVTTGAPAYVEEIVLAGGPTFPPVPLPKSMNAYALYIIAAFQEAHPEIDVNSALNDEGRRLVELAKSSCLDQMGAVLKGVNVAQIFSKPLGSAPGLEPALRDFAGTPTGGYDRPVFMGHGLQDQDVPTPIGVVLNSDMWLNQFQLDATRRNNRVEVRWYPTDHGQTVMASVPHSTPFLHSIFAG